MQEDVCPSVCPSVTCWYCKHHQTFSLSFSHAILVFPYKPYRNILIGTP